MATSRETLHQESTVLPWDGRTEADLDRYLDDRGAEDKRLFERLLIEDYGWSPASYLTQETLEPWRYVTSGCWYRRAMLRGEAD